MKSTKRTKKTSPETVPTAEEGWRADLTAARKEAAQFAQERQELKEKLIAAEADASFHRERCENEKKARAELQKKARVGYGYKRVITLVRDFLTLVLGEDDEAGSLPPWQASMWPLIVSGGLLAAAAANCLRWLA